MLMVEKESKLGMVVASPVSVHYQINSILSRWLGRIEQRVICPSLLKMELDDRSHSFDEFPCTVADSI